MLKALSVEGLSWMTRLFDIAWRSGIVPRESQTGVVVPLFKKGDQRVCANYRGITLLSLPGRIRSERSKAGSAPVMERQTSFSLSQGSWRGPSSMPVQSACVLWICGFTLWEVLREYGVRVTTQGHPTSVCPKRELCRCPQ